MKPEQKKNPMMDLAKERVEQVMRRWDPGAEVEIDNNRITVRVDSNVVPKLIGKKGKNIEEVEKQLGMSISVESKDGSLKGEIPWQYEESGAYVNLRVESGLAGVQVDILKGRDYLFSAHVGKNGIIRIKKKSTLGRKVVQAIAGSNLRILQ